MSRLANIRLAITASLSKLAWLCEIEDQEPDQRLADNSMSGVTWSLRSSGWLYLWTFTTPDVVDLGTLTQRWADLKRSKGWRKIRMRGVRAFEPHPLGHGWHVHLVAVTRYDVETIRVLVTRFGFGRVNVARIPWKRAHYIVKYLRKYSRGEVEFKKRLWACVGFKGVSVSDCSVTNSHVIDVMRNTCGFAAAKDWSWQCLETWYWNDWKVRMAIPPVLSFTMDANLQKVLLAHAEKGERVQLVEYRGSKIRSWDKNVVGQKPERKFIVQHACEAGPSTARDSFTVEEWLPDGSTGDFVPPFKLPTLAVLVIDGSNTFKGVTTYKGRFFVA